MFLSSRRILPSQLVVTPLSHYSHYADARIIGGTLFPEGTFHMPVPSSGNVPTTLDGGDHGDYKLRGQDHEGAYEYVWTPFPKPAISFMQKR